MTDTITVRGLNIWNRVLGFGLRFLPLRADVADSGVGGVVVLALGGGGGRPQCLQTPSFVKNNNPPPPLSVWSLAMRSHQDFDKRFTGPCCKELCTHTGP